MPADEVELARDVAKVAEGNPFFVTEYVRSAVSERLIDRHEGQVWRMKGAGGDRSSMVRALALPGSLHDLIDRRLRALSPPAQEFARTAAVLGREFSSEVAIEVVDTTIQASTLAIDELLRRQVLEANGPERLRFVHDKLREAAYAGLNDRLPAVHGRVASVLERRSSARPDAAEGWAILGHHFAEAGQPAQAARYFQLAGDHARATFANADAVVLYRRAVSQLEQLASPEDAASWRRMLLACYEAMGDILAISGHPEPAKAAYAETVCRLGDSDALIFARLHRKTGKIWEWAGKHRHALDLYVRAREALPSVFASNVIEARDEWILARFDELRVYYWLGRLPELAALLDELRPVVERYAAPERAGGFHQCRLFHDLATERFAISESTLHLAGQVVEASRTANASERAWALFQRGFVLHLLGRPEAAEHDMLAALELAQRAGDVINQARASLYLAVTARMQGAVETTAARCLLAVKVASDVGMPQYIAAAKAIDAWVSLQRGDRPRALALADEALTVWAGYGGVFPFHWLALVPRLEAQLARGEIAGAVESSCKLLAPDQRRLPTEAETAIRAAIAAWDTGQPDSAQRSLEQALGALGERRFR
ncbi:MAG: hypothetical protein JOZ69_17390 [Myxococcales bacterium]|nr:hypothetical protein [Myxococcales bacterium]